MAHARAKLTPLGRALLVQRVVVMGWAPARAAETAGVSRPTVYKWVRRFTEEGVDGLLDRTSAPHRHPNALPVREVRRILRARRDLGWGPHRLGPWLGHPRSTVYGVLRREKVPRLGELDRPTKTPIRYERDRPGELIHVDVKKLGRASGEGPVLIGDLGGCLGRLLACRALLDLLGRGARWRRRAPASEVRLSVRAAERARVKHGRKPGENLADRPSEDGVGSVVEARRLGVHDHEPGPGASRKDPFAANRRPLAVGCGEERCSAPLCWISPHVL